MNKLNDTFIEWEIVQDGMCVVACNNREETNRYAMQYVEDGDIEIWKVQRTLVAKASSSASLRKGKK